MKPIDVKAAVALKKDGSYFVAGWHGATDKEMIDLAIEGNKGQDEMAWMTITVSIPDKDAPGQWEIRCGGMKLIEHLETDEIEKVVIQFIEKYEVTNPAVLAIRKAYSKDEFINLEITKNKLTSGVTITEIKDSNESLN